MGLTLIICMLKNVFFESNQCRSFLESAMFCNKPLVCIGLPLFFAKEGRFFFGNLLNIHQLLTFTWKKRQVTQDINKLKLPHMCISDHIRRQEIDKRWHAMEQLLITDVPDWQATYKLLTRDWQATSMLRASCWPAIDHRYPFTLKTSVMTCDHTDAKFRIKQAIDKLLTSDRLCKRPVRPSLSIFGRTI